MHQKMLNIERLGNLSLKTLTIFKKLTIDIT